MNVLVVVLALLGSGATGLWRAGDPWSRAAVALLAVAAVALWWRRSRPLAVLSLAVVSNVAHLALSSNGSFPVDVATVLAAYAIAVYGPSPTREIAGGAAATVLAAAYALRMDSLPGVAAGLAVAGVPWLVGEYVRTRGRIAAERAEADAYRAVVEERARIARELHDVVAHHVAVMGMQAGAARMAIDADGGGPVVRDALGAIEETGRRANDEMRRMVGGLRAPEGGRLAELPALVEGFRAAGLPVELTVEAPIEPAETVQLSAYRIVEQSLTNVLEHAGVVPTRVSVVANGDGVSVEVVNAAGNAARRSGSGRGHGSAGMRERVAMFGGTLETGALPGGGYRVRAHLP